MKPPSLAVLTNAFYDLHRPAYHAYAAAHLTPEEAQVAVSQLFDLVASTWTTVVAEQHPSAWAWQRLTRAVARRSGHPSNPAEDAYVLRTTLLLSIDQIATLTGTEPATVVSRLAAVGRARAAAPRPPRRSPSPPVPGQTMHQTDPALRHTPVPAGHDGPSSQTGDVTTRTANSLPHLA
ncbi:hypothetical protein [Streptomyces sp. NBC_00102]|uniref:hypothetical protein n=1 Tax=Streptomyces sp. NBC_00102 TaxID=2975652 RepID=UPI00225104E2|nr:hypothetical protein [Streptomyces sp. NBC_00102]MCX5401989.1 hypothetical protein [Streptomyces sp. NBC_00102]